MPREVHTGAAAREPLVSAGEKRSSSLPRYLSKDTLQFIHRSISMAQIRVSILDHTGGTKTVVELPDDVPLNRLLPELVDQLGLPTQQAGTPVSYRLDIPEAGTRVGDEETLEESGVETGTILSLLPEVTAGAGGR